MDDIADSRPSVEEVIKLTKEIDTILESGHFKTKGWSSNEKLPGETSQESTVKVLGLKWDRRSDRLSLVIKPDTKSREGLEETEVLTKRRILSIIAGIYDYFGMACPVTVLGKMGLQDLWKTNLDWDEPIMDQRMRKIWVNWIRDIRQLETYSIPRCLRPFNAVGSPSLIVFTDASEKAFGAVAYARWELGEGGYSTRFIMAKSRVAPIRETLSVPRLELQGLVIGSRLANTILKEGRYEWGKIIVFTDSRPALAWVINDTREYKQFVSVRVSEIRTKLNKACFRYITTDLNVADMLTRGIRLPELNGLWQTGPEFLTLPDNQWPKFESGDSDNEIAKTEERRQINANVQINAVATDGTKIESLWNVLGERCSNLNKAIRVAAWVLRAIANFKTGREKMRDIKLSLEELSRAEMELIKSCQASTKKNVANYINLTPQIDEHGLLRVGGRVNEMKCVSYDTKHPYLLEKGWLSKLIVEHFHNSGHTGVTATVAKVRRKYWIVGLQRMAKSVKFRCVICRMLDKVTSNQLMGQLPADKLLMGTPAFHTCAIDLFGPLTAKFGYRKTQKLWAVVIVCLNTGALYADIVQDYSSNSLWMTLRRFFSIRGTPSVIYSDQGSNLTGLYNQMEDKIKWRFVTEKAAHQNGNAEALVKTTKRTLAQTLSNETLYPIEIQTVLFEAAQIINQRPLGVINSEPDGYQYICPNDLLFGRATSQTPQGPFKEPCNLKQRFEMCQRLIDSWWSKWYKQVFPTLIPRRKWVKDQRNICVGDYVLVKDPNPVRSHWTKGVIEECLEGRDGRVRNVKIKVGPNIYVERPITVVSVIHPVEGFPEA
jgi:hypothetical protein